MENKFKKYLIEQEEIEMEQELEETKTKVKEFIKTSEELSMEKLVEFAEESEIEDIEGLVLNLLKTYIISEEEGIEEETEVPADEEGEEEIEESEEELEDVE